MKRVYVPTTLAVWQRLVANGSMFQVSGTAFAVTPGESYAEQHKSSRVAPAHCCAGAPSEPSERVAPHSAQASPEGVADSGLLRRRACRLR